MDINKEQNMEQAILEAAENLFLEKGFAMTTTTEIAHVAGCNQALVHYYFRTKEKLFNSIFQNKAKLFLSQFLKSGDDNISFEDKIKLLIEAHFNILKENPKLPFLMFNEFTTNPQRFNSVKAEIGHIAIPFISKMQTELQREIDKGNIRPITIVDLIITVISLNVFLFIAKPIFDTVLNLSPEQNNIFYEQRKQENTIIILKSLKP